MTRDEAIEKALDIIAGRLKNKNTFVGQISDDGELIHVGELSWDYSPPRRIPEKGTMVKDVESGVLGYFSGEYHMDNPTDYM